MRKNASQLKGVCEKGNYTLHAAIVDRTMNIIEILHKSEAESELQSGHFI